MLIIHLYEISVVKYTLEYSSGIATFKYVRENLPKQTEAFEFVAFRDDLVHNLNRTIDFNVRLQTFLLRFTKENFISLAQFCGVSTGIYDELLSYSQK